MIWLFILCQITDPVVANEDKFPSAYFITWENRWLAGYLEKTTESDNIMLCSQACLRNSWCTSTNFKESVGQGDKGTCELNKHEFAPINDDSKLIDQSGTTFVMILKGCLMTGCVKGDDCLFDKKKETFTCSCKLSWGGDQCEACQGTGVADRNTIPDDGITANTFSHNYYPYYGRLNETRGNGGWCPENPSDGTNYLQVDMGAVRSVCAVETQGVKTGDYWTKSYTLQFSSDEATWKSYTENNTEKVFQGNTDELGIVHQPLSTAVQARYVRFYPVTYKNWPCLKVEIRVRRK